MAFRSAFELANKAGVFLDDEVCHTPLFLYGPHLLFQRPFSSQSLLFSSTRLRSQGARGLYLMLSCCELATSVHKFPRARQ